MEVSAAPISILLVDDHPLVLEGVRGLLRRDAGVRVAATATSGPEALRQLRQNPAIEVVLTDLHMPLMAGSELVRRIRQEFPQMRVVALSIDHDLATVQDVLAAGAAGYILKNALGPELSTAIRRVAAGHTYFCPEVASLLLQQLALPSQPTAHQPAALTPRELEILHLIAEEKSSFHIADQLHISERTVETHRKNILTKTGCKSVIGLLQYALRHKLISL